MSRAFTKMHGLGNDFVVFDALREPLELDARTVRRLAHRHFGVGCDQVLVVEPARSAGADVYYRIFNADGAEVQQCGNGVRCVARYLIERGVLAGPVVTVESLAGLVRVDALPDGRVRVDMGVPKLEPEEVPFVAACRERTYAVRVNDQVVELVALSMGNPHAVLPVADVDLAPVAELGLQLGRLALFPEGVNVGFLQVLDAGRARLRVFERGSGETLACGTGACAAAVAGRLLGVLGEQVEVELPGGRLDIAWAGEGQSVFMTGPAVTVFEGSIEL